MSGQRPIDLKDRVNRISALRINVATGASNQTTYRSPARTFKGALMTSYPIPGPNDGRLHPGIGYVPGGLASLKVAPHELGQQGLPTPYSGREYSRHIGSIQPRQHSVRNGYSEKTFSQPPKHPAARGSKTHPFPPYGPSQLRQSHHTRLVPVQQKPAQPSSKPTSSGNQNKLSEEADDIPWDEWINFNGDEGDGSRDTLLPTPDANTSQLL